MNRYGALTPRDFKSLASAYSATSANYKKLMEAPSRFELEMKVLQTSALPLGYGAIKLRKVMERETRFELATFTLAR